MPPMPNNIPGKENAMAQALVKFAVNKRKKQGKNSLLFEGTAMFFRKETRNFLFCCNGFSIGFICKNLSFVALFFFNFRIFCCRSFALLPALPNNNCFTLVFFLNLLRKRCRDHYFF